MNLEHLMDWIGGVLAIGGALWMLVKSVHVRINVRVRKLDQPPADDGGPKFTFEGQAKVEHGRPIRFGTRGAPPG